MREAVRRPGVPSARARSSVATVLARTALGVLVLLLLVSAGLAAAGWQATVVTSGSMAPRVQPGDLTLARPIDPADLAPGQVLLVDDPDSPGGLRLHRLVAVTDGGLRLQGDANPTADSSLVDPAAVHGVGTLRLPGLGLPALWASEHRWLPVAAAALGLGSLAGLVVLRRSPVPSRRGVPTTALRTTAVLAAALLLPGTATAAFSATTANGASSFGSARFYSCASAASGSTAAQYLALQETSGTVARNTGTFSGDGTYAGGVTYGVTGPVCRSASQAVRLDGSSGFVYTSIEVVNPQTFSTQLWFSTTTTTGGFLIGFGAGTNGARSVMKDRLAYMSNNGHVTFGVWDGEYHTVTSSASYNDGRWHQLTATFSADTGIRLFMDGALVDSDATATTAENSTGYFRAGFDNLDGWPDRPTSEYFAGSIAHMGVYATRLTETDVAAQFAAVG